METHLNSKLADNVYNKKQNLVKHSKLNVILLNHILDVKDKNIIELKQENEMLLKSLEKYKTLYYELCNR